MSEVGPEPTIDPAITCVHREEAIISRHDALFIYDILGQIAAGVDVSARADEALTVQRRLGLGLMSLVEGDDTIV